MKNGRMHPTVINEIAVQNRADIKRASDFRFDLIQTEPSSGPSKALMIAILAVIAAMVFLGG